MIKLIIMPFESLTMYVMQVIDALTQLNNTAHIVSLIVHLDLRLYIDLYRK